MSFTQTFVIARSDQPLTQLAANARIREGAEPCELSWARPDGWQCLAPYGFYDDELVPPVVDIQGELGTPVLAIGVDRSARYVVKFIEGGVVRAIDVGSYTSVSRMVATWGQPDWEVRAAESLARWAECLGQPVSLDALFAVTALPQLFAEQNVFDLLQLLGLDAPDAATPWWAAAGIPASFAVRAENVRRTLREFESLSTAQPSGLALASTASGIGVWDCSEGVWLHSPMTLKMAVRGLHKTLRERGWSPASALST